MDFLASIMIMHGFVLVMGLMFGALGFMFATAIFRKEPVRKWLMGTSIGLFGAMFAVLIFMGILNPTIFGFGLIQDDFKFVAVQENVLWGEDSILMGDGDGGIASEMYRIQGIDLDKGTRVFRDLVGSSFDILGIKNGWVWAKKDQNLVGYDFATGGQKVLLNEQTIAKYSPKLEKGVFSYSLNPKTLLVDVTAKDGTEISVDPSADFTSSSVDIDDKKDIEIEDTRITRDNYVQLFALSDVAKKQLTDGQGHVLNDQLFFLNGKFLQYDEKTQRVFVTSSTSLDVNDKGYVLRCLSLKGDLMWELKDSDLEESNFLNIEPRPDAAVIYKDQLILAAGNVLFSLNISDGHVKWEVRL